MLILAFETSAKAASVALMENGKLLGESYQNTGLTHSQTLMVMAEDLLNQCGKTYIPTELMVRALRKTAGQIVTKKALTK